MGHATHALNDSFIVSFGGDGKGGHMNDVYFAVPNKLAKAFKDEV